jgi:hypothetical protein
MAINSMTQPPLRHLGRITSSGSFTVPDGASRLYVSVNGAQGANSNGGTRGNSIRGNGYVNVIPGKEAQVIIGAGTGAGSGAQAGTTTFDGAITVTGSTSGSTGRYGPQGGGVGTVTFITSLPGGAPSGAAVRTTSTSSSNQDIGNAANGFVDIYG